MTFKWLPDAALDPHPRLTWFTECCFDLAVLGLYRKEVTLPPDYRLAPGTLVVSNHQRDADVPLLTTVLCQRKGLRIRWPLPFYAMREDLLRRGALADLLVQWPRVFRAPLRALSLGWFFRIVRAEPMRRLREFTFGETLDSLLATGFGEMNSAAIFNARGRRELVAALGIVPPRLDAIRLRRADALRCSHWGLRRLRLAAFRALKPVLRSEIAAQLGRFAALLDAGRVVYFAPEGTISPDGRCGRIRDGVWRLVQSTGTPPPILPLALSYDVLAPGRPRVIVRVGSLRKEYDTRDRRRFEADLKREIREHYAVNTSHLLSRYLSRGPARFTRDDLAQWFRRAMEAITSAGLQSDPLVTRGDVRTLADERLRWLARTGLVTHDAEGWHNRLPPARPGWRNPSAVVRYLDNALDDHLGALAPQLARELVP